MPMGKGNHPGANTTYKGTGYGKTKSKSIRADTSVTTSIGSSGADREAWRRATTGDYGGFGSLARSNTSGKDYMEYARNQLKQRDKDEMRQMAKNVKGYK